VAELIEGNPGELRRFMLEHHPVRGFWVRVDSAWRELRGFQEHAPPVESLLGQAVSASLLLAATLKFRGTLTMQLSGQGQVKLLVAQCTHEYDVRAVARVDETAADAVDYRQLVGNGRLTVTIESEERSMRYQGIVALEGDTLAACLENYFATSEQLPTRLILIADSERACGVLIQKMPAASAQGEAQAAVSQTVWEELETRLQDLPVSTLRDASAQQVLQDVCGDYDCRLFAASQVRFACRCNQARVASVLRALGPQEIRDILAEQGAVTVTCEFCGRPYSFDVVDIERLFTQGASPDPPLSLN
jgi:molecular chaperone Hsp33